MAEGILRRALKSAGHPEIEVASSGTWGLRGEPATAHAVDVMSSTGIDISTHVARSLEPADIVEADLVLAMTSVHLGEIEELVPGSRDKVFLVKELVELDEATMPPGATPEERAAGLRRARRAEWRRALDLDDPMGLPRFAYERAASEIEAGITRLVEILVPSPPDRS